jgi:mRNA interferase RelE/StbE
MFELLIEKRAEKGFKKIPTDTVKRLITKIKRLRNDPRPSGCRKIEGAENAYRIRLGDYRIVYEIDEDKKQIIVFAVGHRKDIYRDF